MTSPQQESVKQALEHAPWLGPDASALADALASQGRVAAFDKGAWLQGEGDEETGLFVVIEGAVQLYCNVPGDREVLIGHAERGAAIGQAIRFGGGPRLVTAICVEPSQLLILSDTVLERIGRVQPEVWQALSRLGYMLLSFMLRVMAETIALPPRQRLASRLLMLSQRPAGADPVLRLSQSDLAEMLGLTRKTVNGYLGEMAAQGLIELGYGRIVMRDVARLRQLANS